jgi:hypothetical protein
VRVVRDHGFRTVGELHEFQELVAALASRGFIEAIHAADKFQIFRSTETFEESHTLRNDTDLTFQLHQILREIETEESNSAGARSQKPG